MGTAWLLALLWMAEPSVAHPGQDYFYLKQERIRAYRDGDRAYFEKLLADDFLSLSPSGRRVTKQDYLAAEFGEGQREALRTETEVGDFEAMRTGDTLVLSYEEWEKTKIGEQVFREHLRRLDVYTHQQGRWRLQTMTAVRVPEAPPTITMGAEQLGAYAGHYDFGPGLVSVVRIEGGRLMEQTTGQPASELLPVGADSFYAPPDVEARVEFERGPEGRVVAQVYRSGSQRIRAPRVP